MTTDSTPGALGSNDQLGAGAEARCMCKDRALSACPGEWEPGCDLGNNPAHVRVHHKPQHVCGMQGFGALGDKCPGCKSA